MLLKFESKQFTYDRQVYYFSSGGWFGGLVIGGVKKTEIESYQLPTVRS